MIGCMYLLSLMIGSYGFVCRYEIGKFHDIEQKITLLVQSILTDLFAFTIRRWLLHIRRLNLIATSMFAFLDNQTAAATIRAVNSFGSDKVLFAVSC